MTDYIERDVAIKICNMPNYNIHDILFALKTIPGKMIPAADVRENAPGHWILEDESDVYELWKCSVCENSIFDHMYSFCPNCGADMRGKKDDRVCK